MEYISLNKKTILILIILVSVIVAYIVFSVVSKEEDVVITREHYENAIALINEKLPVTLDSETQLRSIQLLGNTIQYTYVLLNKQKYEIKITELENSFKKEVLKTYCANSDVMITFRNSGYIAEYIYRDSASEIIFTTQITPRECLNL